jgi:hypothetical protein
MHGASATKHENYADPVRQNLHPFDLAELLIKVIIFVGDNAFQHNQPLPDVVEFLLNLIVTDAADLAIEFCHAFAVFKILCDQHDQHDVKPEIIKYVHPYPFVKITLSRRVNPYRLSSQPGSGPG